MLSWLLKSCLTSIWKQQVSGEGCQLDLWLQSCGTGYQHVCRELPRIPAGEFLLWKWDSNDLHFKMSCTLHPAEGWWDVTHTTILTLTFELPLRSNHSDRTGEQLSPLEIWAACLWIFVEVKTDEQRNKEKQTNMNNSCSGLISLNQSLKHHTDD